VIERFVTLKPTRAVSSARMAIGHTFGSLKQRLASSDTLQPLRRVVWIWVAAALLLVFGAVGATAGKLSSGYKHRVDERLNVVVILSDDERSDGTSVMKNVQKLLAGHGVTFTNAHVTTSMCGPSRASILTGQYAHHTGVLDNFGRHSYPAFKAGEESNDLAVWMHEAGYKTGLVGKYVNSYTDGFVDHAVPPGWDDWQVMDSIPMEAYYNYSINNNGHIENYGNKPSDYSTTVLTHKAVNFIHRARHPFFLYFAPVAPHLPALPDRRDLTTPLALPKPRPDFDERDLADKPWHRLYRRLYNERSLSFLDRDIEGRQLRSLRELDRDVGSLMGALRSKGVLDNTIVIYASDNGFLWGEHRLGGKLWPYEESIRVPLVVRVPWRSEWGRTDDHLVLNTDYASTIAQLAGVRPRLPQDGRSLVPLLEGQSPPWRHAFVEEYLGASRYRYGGPPPYRALRTTRWLWVEYRNGWRELYDLRRDPYELSNLARDPRYAPLEASLSARLAALDRRRHP